jgi:hypothetical protein
MAEFLKIKFMIYHKKIVTYQKILCELLFNKNFYIKFVYYIY